MRLPLEGKWIVKCSDNAAADVLPAKTRHNVVRIKVKDGNYQIKCRFSHEWTIHFMSTRSAGTAKGVESNVICGEINSGQYGFVITGGRTKKNKKKGRLLGIIYPGTIGDGSDPGTWEADEEGSGEEECED